MHYIKTIPFRAYLCFLFLLFLYCCDIRLCFNLEQTAKEEKEKHVRIRQGGKDLFFNQKVACQLFTFSFHILIWPPNCIKFSWNYRVRASTKRKSDIKSAKSTEKAANSSMLRKHVISDESMDEPGSVDNSTKGNDKKLIDLIKNSRLRINLKSKQNASGRE